MSALSIPTVATAGRVGLCDGLLGRESSCPYKQHHLAAAYLKSYTDGAKYRKDNNITLFVPGITNSNVERVQETAQ